MAEPRAGRRPWSFYALAAFFTLFVLFLYGPMSAIYILSFQGPNGGLTFPLNGVSLNWFYALFQQQRTGDIAGSFARSIGLALLVLVLTVVISVMAGLAFRRRFVGAGVIFYMAIASLIMPGLLVSLGIGLMFQFLGIRTGWYTSALGAHLTWTLPFGLLIMFAVFSRFNRAYEEAARDLGASRWAILWTIVLPILLPGMIAVALFGFTLSYDEFPRTSIAVGPSNTLPLEIWNMTTNVTSPALYAIGTVTTAVSFLVITLALSSIALIQRRRTRRHGPQGRERRLTHGSAGRDPARAGDQAVRPDGRGPGHRACDPARLLLLPARALGLRQDDDPADDRGPRGAERGPGADRRRRRHRARAGRPRHRDDVPELRAVPAHDRARQRRLQPAHARGRQGGAPRAGAGDAGAGASGGVRRPDAGAALGWPAAAGGARPGPDHQPPGAAARRAALGAR